MIFRKIFFILFSILILCAQGHAFDPVVDDLSAKNLPALTIPKIDKIELNNGAKIYYLKDDELPVFKMKVYIDGLGAVYEQKDARGLTGVFMSAWRSGGTTTLKPEVLDEKLEFVAANISTDSEGELSSIKMNCLHKDAQQVLDIFFDVIRHPAFDAERFGIIKKNSLNRIKQRNEEAIDVALREFMQSLYGQDSPHAWKATPETINAMTQDTLKQFYESHVAPNRMLIAASSPLSFDDFLKTIEPYFEGWDKKLPQKANVNEVNKEWDASKEFIHKDGNQSAIVIGHFGEKRFNADKFKIILANEILGGTTFGSRLGDRIRTDLGLAYSIGSNFGFDTVYGSFAIVTQTKSESTVDTVNEITKIFSDMIQQKNITENELKHARERIINRLIFEYDIPFNIVTMELIYSYHGYPSNYLAIFQKEIEKVTLSDLLEILPEYFFPDKLKVMIVGDKTKIKSLDTLPDLVQIPLDNE